ncbi:MAG: short-chain dehydrogenase [Pseudomonadota bacterium]
MSTEDPKNNGIPAPHEFFLDVPLYEEFHFDDDEHGEQARDIKYHLGTIDSYCPWCGRESVFERPSKNIEHSLSSSTYDQVFSVSLKCSRNEEHELFYVVKIQNNVLQKIGQFPSLADLQLQDLKKYSKILGRELYREFTKAVGLSAHGVGVGSFVYLRRIFESLIEKAHVTASASEGWNKEEYQKSRVAEQIALLKGFLPDFLVEHTKLYSIMSKGIHELSENECLKYFPVIKLGIELILDEKLDILKKEEKLKAASKAIHNAGIEIETK